MLSYPFIDAAYPGNSGQPFKGLLFQIAQRTNNDSFISPSGTIFKQAKGKILIKVCIVIRKCQASKEFETMTELLQFFLHSTH